MDFLKSILKTFFNKHLPRLPSGPGLGLDPAGTAMVEMTADELLRSTQPRRLVGGGGREGRDKSCALVQRTLSNSEAH